jgi:hypothetical protein
MQGLLIWLVERQSKGTTSELPPIAARAVYSSSPWVAQLGEKCLASTQTWIEHLSYLLKSYIRYSRALMGLESQAAEASASPGLAGLDAPKNQGGGAKDEEDLVPLKMAKSLSLPIARQPHQGVRLSPAETSIQLIKSFMALLLEPDQAKPSQPSVHGAEGSSLLDKIEEKPASCAPTLQHMPQVWGLVLESFTTVSVSKLVEARIVDALLRAFLRAS